PHPVLHAALPILIAASNRDLQSLIAAGRFREDLFYRLNVIPIEVPALRVRQDDLPQLVDHFVRVFCAENGKRVKTLSGDALAYLLAYEWPGNVRELRNLVERLVIMSPRDVIGVEDLPPPVRPKEAVAGDVRERSLREARDNFERAYILAELRASEWNLTRTAERLGIERGGRDGGRARGRRLHRRGDAGRVGLGRPAPRAVPVAQAPGRLHDGLG